MRLHRPARLLLSATILAALSIAGCSSSPAATIVNTTTAAPAPATATFTGDFTGTMEVTLCTQKIGSLEVHVAGDSTVYRGSVSTLSMGFVGPGGGPFALSSKGHKPKVSRDGNTFTVNGVVLDDETLTHKKVTLTGKLHCP